MYIKEIHRGVSGKGKSSDRFHATAIKILNQNLLAFCNGDPTSKNSNDTHSMQTSGILYQEKKWIFIETKIEIFTFLT